MDIRTLMQRIEIPEGFAARAIDFAASLDLSEYEEAILQILVGDTRHDGYENLTDMLGEDADGVKIFTLEIIAAARAHDGYARLGIPDEIYFDTMAAFKRQLDESYTDGRGYVFDRGEWDIRHTSMSLFRIGALEYELTNKYGEDVIAVHIPSDANLTDENMDSSFAAARDFLRRYYPTEAERRITCGTWLLSPKLVGILPVGSKILKFQSKFHIEFTYGGEGCLRWVFGITGKSFSETDLDTLSEKTSLQRAIKAVYKSGGSIGQAYGIYKENESVGLLRPGKYRHYKGKEYELIGTARHSETLDLMIVYKALYGEGDTWVRPAYMWEQRARLGDTYVPRFEFIGE